MEEIKKKLFQIRDFYGTVEKIERDFHRSTDTLVEESTKNPFTEREITSDVDYRLLLVAHNIRYSLFACYDRISPNKLNA